MVDQAISPRTRLRELLGEMPNTVAYSCTTNAEELYGALIIIAPKFVVLTPPNRERGLSLVRLIKNVDRACDVAIVGYGGLEPEDQQHYEQAGAQWYFSGTTDWVQVLDVVRQLGSQQ